jgi:hypothetical protein
MSDDTLILTDHQGRTIRLTAERQMHILEHPELEDQLDRLKETIAQPSVIIATAADETVHVYHRHYASTPVSSKYLLVAVKILETDAFVRTAFFSSRQKQGEIVWQA